MEGGVVDEEAKRKGKGGREGDWECNGCRNRNYAFRSLCNRCKQPRVLVDTNTPSHSKWLPRIGDWICIGCTNNNYASREKCKKCGEPKEVAAVPAIEMPGSNVFARAHGFVAEQRTNMSLFANGTKHPLAPANNWSMGGADTYGIQQTPYFKYENAFNMTNQSLMGSKGWRIGDWTCTCGFHNYASRAECKKCNATMPPALGTKRLASDEINKMDSKRPNVTHAFGLQHAYPSFHHTAVSGGYPSTGVFIPSLYPGGNSSMVPNLQTNPQFLRVETTPTLLGKGAMQWRDGDWLCPSCSNHNYACRTRCNRCKTEKDALAQPVNVA